LSYGRAFRESVTPGPPGPAVNHSLTNGALTVKRRGTAVEVSGRPGSAGDPAHSGSPQARWCTCALARVHISWRLRVNGRVQAAR